MENLNWQYEGTIEIFDDIILTNPTIKVKNLVYEVGDMWYVNLLFLAPGQAHQRMFEVENANGFEDLTQTDIENMISNEYPDFIQT